MSQKLIQLGFGAHFTCLYGFDTFKAAKASTDFGMRGIQCSFFSSQTGTANAFKSAVLVFISVPLRAAVVNFFGLRRLSVLCFGYGGLLS